MNETARISERTPGVWPARPRPLGPGLSMSLFAGLALIATFSARALAPALPGSATGISRLIDVTSFIAACSSQLLAAGGIALCLRALGNLLPWPSLGVGFRMLIVPVTLAVVAFTVASASQPLSPEFSRIIAVAAIVATSVALPLLWSSADTRPVALTFLLATLGAAFHLVAYEISRRGGFLNPWPRSSAAAAALSLFLDVGASLAALVFASRTRVRSLTTLAILFAGVILASILAQLGASRWAQGPAVVLYRSLDALAQRPFLALPRHLAQALSLIPFLSAAALLGLPGRSPQLRAALALCLLGRLATGAPAAALLSVGAALTALSQLLQAQPPREDVGVGAPVLRTP